jgi:hypothetical protein
VTNPWPARRDHIVGCHPEPINTAIDKPRYTDDFAVPDMPDLGR